MVTKNCIYCGKEFRIQPSKAEISKCCSKECKDNYKRQGGKRTCERCGKEFYYSPSQEHTAKYCSRECKVNVQGRITLKCQKCGKEFIVPPNRKNAKFCSKECGTRPDAKITKICECCGKKFKIPKCRENEAKYCSLECAYKHMKIRETPNRKKIHCDNCGKDIVRYNYQLSSNNNFCSVKCYSEFQNKQIELRCLCCGKSFKVKKSTFENSNPRYCSWDCRKKHLKGIYWIQFSKEKKICPICNKEFYAKKSEVLKGKGIYCSKRCYHKSMEDENPTESKHFYGTAFWRELREECYKRDNYTCQLCGKTKEDKNLHAHHIKPRVLGGEDKIENLVTLCNSCHQKTERKFKRARRAKLKTE